MSEKGDLHQDTDSLPPHYASSEVYSDSPPPAYRKTSTVRLQITKIVCLTILLGGFLIGSFILAHTYVQNQRSCNCEHNAASNLPPMSDALIQANVLPQLDNDLVAPKEEEPKESTEPLASDDLQKSRQIDIDIPLNEEEIQADVEMAGRALEEEVEELQRLDEEEKEVVDKKVKLPMDLLLGNPALTGKDVQCKVEKKIKNLGNGVFSRTIMVKCDDDDDNKTPQLIRGGPMGFPPRPPMSFLAPILKMMASRAEARFQKEQEHPQQQQVMPKIVPKIMVARLPISPMSAGPFPFPGPIHGSQMSSPMPEDRMIRHNNEEPKQAPRKIRIIQRSKPEMRIIQGSIRPNMIPFPFMGPRPMNFRPTEEEDAETFKQEPTSDNMLFREDFNNRDEPPHHPFSDVEEHHGPEEHHHEHPMNMVPEFPPQHEPEMNVVGPFHQPEERPIKIIRGVPPQIPDAIKEIVSSIMRRENEKHHDEGNNAEEHMKPVIAIKAIPQIATINENEEPQQPAGPMHLPFPFRPVKIIGGRGARKLDLNDEEFQPANNLPFPLPRGAIPAEMQKPLNMLEAEGRALESPVTIPAPPDMAPNMRFFPGGLVRIPLQVQPLHEIEEPKNHLEAPRHLFPTSAEHIDMENQDNAEEFLTTAQPLNLLVTEDPAKNTNIFGNPKNQDVIDTPRDEVGQPPFLRADEVSNEPPFLESEPREVPSFTHDEADLPNAPKHHIVTVN